MMSYVDNELLCILVVRPRPVVLFSASIVFFSCSLLDLLCVSDRRPLTCLAWDLLQANRHVGDLFEDLRDGLNLISLLEVLSGEYLVSTRLSTRRKKSISPRSRDRVSISLDSLVMFRDFESHRRYYERKRVGAWNGNWIGRD